MLLGRVEHLLVTVAVQNCEVRHVAVLVGEQRDDGFGKGRPGDRVRCQDAIAQSDLADGYDGATRQQYRRGGIEAQPARWAHRSGRRSGAVLDRLLGSTAEGSLES